MTDDLQIQDLPTQDVDARDAEQVRGGLNPQPLPPRWSTIFQPPVYQPPIVIPIIRW